MPLLASQNNTVKTSGKTAFRNTTRCLKLTAEEARMLDEIAARQGVARSEWMREMILRGLHSEPSHDSSLAEIVGVRLLLVNVLRPLAAGQKVPVETFDKLLNQISTAKHELAAELGAGKGK